MKTPVECKHRQDPLSDSTGRNYTAWHADAEHRKRQGRDEQRFCKVCQKWLWLDLWDEESK